MAGDAVRRARHGEAGLMDALHAWLVAPFTEFPFMARALVASLALALACGPIGTLLVIRRMSLVGDAMAHALLPGTALAFVLWGLDLAALGLGAFVGGLAVAALAGVLTRHAGTREDASFAAFYLVALAAGVVLISTHGSGVDLLHILFGTVLAVDAGALVLVAAIATVTLVALAALYRPIVVDAFDPAYLQRTRGRATATAVHLAFLALVVLDLVAGFVAMGTLMAVGLMILPAIAARFWGRRLETLFAIAIAIAAASACGGLLWSFHGDVPSGPAIVLVAGAQLLASLAARGWRGRRGARAALERSDAC